MSERLAPILRGVTFDGRKGLIVCRSENKIDAEVSFELPVAGSEAETVKTALETFRKKEGRWPALVELKGSGTYSLADSYASAVKQLETGKPVSMSSSAIDRNSIVKGKVAVVTGGAQGFGFGSLFQLIV